MGRWPPFVAMPGYWSPGMSFPLAETNPHVFGASGVVWCSWLPVSTAAQKPP